MATTDGAPEALGFGALLRHYRERAGLGQERLAERSGVSAAAISNLERGMNQPRLETVQLLAQALGLSDDEHATLRVAARPGPAVLTTLPLHNLPVPPAPLLGREDVVAAVL